MTLAVTDAKGNSSTITLRWVISDNAAPALDNPGDQTTTEGHSGFVQLVASDADDDALSFSATGLPPGLNLDSLTGLISGTVAVGAAGSHEVTAIVSDGSAEDRVAFTWRVEPGETTPPVITPQIEGAVGRNDWYVSDVRVSWTVEDPDSPVSATEGCGVTTLTTDTAGLTFTCEATSRGGTSSASVTIRRDATAPTLVGSRSPAPNAYGWNNTPVTAHFEATDALSGLDGAAVHEAVIGAEGADQSVTHTIHDRAGNAANAHVGGISIDWTPPVVIISSPGGGADVHTEQTLTVEYGATDDRSGVATLAGALDGTPVANGAAIELSAWSGLRTLRTEAQDRAGNAALAAVTFTVRRAIALDIKPGSCPNPLGTRDRGVLPVAIVGLADLDVRDLDLSSIRLEGVAPLRSAIEDAATPYGPPYLARQTRMDCTTSRGDGTADMSLKFDIQTLVQALGPLSDGEVRHVTLTGRLKAERGGTPVIGVDVMWIRSR